MTKAQKLQEMLESKVRCRQLGDEGLTQVTDLLNVVADDFCSDPLGNSETFFFSDDSELTVMRHGLDSPRFFAD
ncbi:MAG: hypothetical protein OXG44_06070 [Gammaproteobacteria bacterium]|nr:hypothetical protein [Gammaproteobacteria bacterium]